jgi:hypothetical protein
LATNHACKHATSADLISTCGPVAHSPDAHSASYHGRKAAY